MGSSQILALLPGVSGQFIRRAFYRYALRSCHPTSVIEFGTIFSRVAAQVGRNVYIGPGCHLGWVDIRDDVLIAAGVHIPSGPKTHGISRMDLPIRCQPGELAQVTVGAGSWIGSGSIVLAEVGVGAVVAAGSVVTQPVADGDVVAGVPARRVRSRQETPEIDRGNDECEPRSI